MYKCQEYIFPSVIEIYIKHIFILASIFDSSFHAGSILWIVSPATC